MELYRRCFPAVVIAGAFLLVLTGCRTAPPVETGKEAASPPSVPDTERAEVPAPPERHVFPETEIGDADDVVEEKAPEGDEKKPSIPWEPPTETAPETPSGEDRRDLTLWLAERPRVVRISDSPVDTDSALRREYLLGFITDTGFRLDRGGSTGKIDESGVVLDFTAVPRIVGSERNFYAATDVRLSMYLQGYGTEEVETIVMGPTVLSTLSHDDAGLNSLLRIDPESLERALGGLGEELSGTLVTRGLAYVIEYSGAPGKEEQYAVLRSLGIPGESENMWYIPLAPVPFHNRISDILSGSDYAFVLNTVTRFGRFIYRDKR